MARVYTKKYKVIIASILGVSNLIFGAGFVLVILTSPMNMLAVMSAFGDDPYIAAHPFSLEALGAWILLFVGFTLTIGFLISVIGGWIAY